MADIDARGLVKQLLVAVTPQTANASIEALAEDSNFQLPKSVVAQALTKQVLLSTTTTARSSHVEVIAASNTAPVNEVRAVSLVKQVALGTTQTVRTANVEVVAADTSFKVPGDTLAKAVNKQVVLASPRSQTVNTSFVEVLGYGNTPTPSSHYAMSVISGLQYSVPVRKTTLEAIAESSFTPPTFGQVSVWFVS